MKNFFFSLICLLSFAACKNNASETTATADKPKAELVKNDAAKGLKVGDKAPDFSLKNHDGTMISLADYAGKKGTILTFTCNHCPYAVMYEDRLNMLHSKYAGQGYPVLAINPNDPEVKPDDSFEKMGERAQEKGFEFAYLFDDGQKVYPQYGATKTPHIFLIDNNQTVRYIGAIDDNPQDEEAVEKRFLEDAIAALEAGNDPEPDYTKAVGCSIKTKKL